MIKTAKNIYFNIASNLLFLHKPSNLACDFASRINLVHTTNYKGQKYRIACPNKVNYWRSKTYLSKEPDVIEWIETFSADDIFYDVGANIGLYSIFAAKQGVKKVVAFEPEALNFALLNQNIFLNHEQDRIVSLNIGLSNDNKLDYLFIPNFEAGHSQNNIGKSMDMNRNEINFEHKQGVISYSLDQFLDKFPTYFPTRIKIDVDGFEHIIIQGALTTLKNLRVKSLMIEINEELKEDLEIIDIVQDLGFQLKKITLSPIVTEKFAKVKNHLFEK